MTRHKHADLIHAWVEDMSTKFECLDRAKGWTEVLYPTWNTQAEYRIKPEPAPDPYAHLRQALKEGKKIWAKQEEASDVMWFQLDNPNFDLPPDCYEIRDKAKPEPKE